jgi:glycerol kinase
MKYIMSLDQGTTSSRCIIFNDRAEIISSDFVEFRQIYPDDGVTGWVEHDPEEILSSQMQAAKSALSISGISPSDISAIGLTNQRETVVVWDKNTGKPLYNAIVWQCRRTAEHCDQLKADGFSETIKSKTGLLIDAYFSATKLKWILDNVPGVRDAAENGTALFGTIDTWLIWHLTHGAVHTTDYSNASRTMLFNIHTLQWDDDLLKLFNIPRQMLPEAKPSSHIFGHTDIFGVDIPIAGVAGDQQAALFGQACFHPGDIKNTYGTGCFILMNTGEVPAVLTNNLLTTIAWGLDGKVEYAVEGSVFIAGAVIGWLRDGLGLISSAAETQAVAESISSNEGVYFVPAFVGLGAPYWDPYARGQISGLTRASTKAHIVRAALEGIAYQSSDVITAMQSESNIEIKTIKVDGGASRNNFLMQFQADILGVEVRRPKVTESSAWGAACLAGLAAGVFSDRESIEKNIEYQTFEPRISREMAAEQLAGWKKAVERARGSGEW